MKVLAGALVEATEFARRALAKRSPIPILDCMKLTVSGTSLTVTGSDLDIEHNAVIEVENSENLTAVVPKRLANVVETLPKTAIVSLNVIELPKTAAGAPNLTNQYLTIACGRGRWRLPTLPAEDFPVLAAPTGAEQFALTRAEALRVIARTIYCVDSADPRPVLQGVFLHRRDDALWAVATDGRRLGLTQCQVQWVPSRCAAIIPLKAIAGLKRLAELSGDDPIVVTADDRAILMQTGGLSMTSKFIDGVYPDYVAHRLIPTASPNTAAVASADLRAAITRLVAVGNPELDVKTIGLEWSAGGLTLSLARDPNGGVESIDATVTGSARVAAQDHFLLDAISGLDAETTTIDHGGDGRPILLTVAGEQTTALIMPMQWEVPKTEQPSTHLRAHR
jgi:DNA polymerase III subunit beta